MGFLQEFKEFAVKGNVIDLAVAVIIGGAFGKITASFVSDIVMPPVGLLLGGVNFTDIKLNMKDAIIDSSGKVLKEAVTMNIGNFIQTLVDFTIIALAVFIMIKAINSLKKKPEPVAPAPPPAPPEPTREEILLTEIRDLLKK